MARTFATTIARIAEFTAELAESLHRDLGLEYRRPSPTTKLPNKKRARTERDPNEPKRPASAYFIFCSQKRDACKAKGEPLPSAKELADIWNNAEDSEKEKYNAEALQLKEQYDAQLASYRATKKVNDIVVRTDDESDNKSEENGDVAPPMKH